MTETESPVLSEQDQHIFDSLVQCTANLFILKELNTGETDTEIAKKTWVVAYAAAKNDLDELILIGAISSGISSGKRYVEEVKQALL